MGVCIKFNVVASPLRGLATLLPWGLIAGGSPRGLIALVTRGNGSPGREWEQATDIASWIVNISIYPHNSGLSSRLIYRGHNLYLNPTPM